MIFLLITYKFLNGSHRLSVRTHGFHPWKRGSIPLGTAKYDIKLNLKTLIIRTDRLGDFYQTIPYINCLTRIYGKTNVDIVVKKHIYFHIKKKKYLYNSLYSFEKNGIFNKVLLILKLRKNNYKQIIIFS